MLVAQIEEGLTMSQFFGLLAAPSLLAIKTSVS